MEIDALRRGCAPAGLDLVAPLSVAAYNARVPEEWRLPTFGRPDALGVVVGNSRALWPRFGEALRREPWRVGMPHPVDDYARDAVLAVVGALEATWQARWANDAPPRGVAMLHAAEVAGLLWRSPAGLGIHPEYGPWVALRAVVVFDREPPAPAPQAQPCAHCASGCLPAFEAARAGRALPHARDVEGAWRAWVAVRDACPLGRAHRYDEAQIRYHYLKDRAVLRALAAAEATP